MRSKICTKEPGEIQKLPRIGALTQAAQLKTLARDVKSSMH